MIEDMPTTTFEAFILWITSELQVGDGCWLETKCLNELGLDSLHFLELENLLPRSVPFDSEIGDMTLGDLYRRVIGR